MYEHAVCVERLSWRMKNSVMCARERGQTCASWWRKIRGPKRVSFLATDAPIDDLVCQTGNQHYFLTLTHPVCKFSWRKKKGKARKTDLGCASISCCPESAVYRAALPYGKTLLYNTQKSRYLKCSPCQGPIVKRSCVAYSCSYALLMTD